MGLAAFAAGFRLLVVDLKLGVLMLDRVFGYGQTNLLLE